MRNLEIRFEDDIKKIYFDGEEVQAQWAQDVPLPLLFEEHGLDIKDKVIKLLVMELDKQFRLTDEESKHAEEVLRQHI